MKRMSSTACLATHIFVENISNFSALLPLRHVITMSHLNKGIVMIAFKSIENHCGGKLQYVLSNSLAILSRSEKDIKHFSGNQKA